MYKILVSGSRREPSEATKKFLRIGLLMCLIGKTPDNVLLVHGDATGIDSTAKSILNKVGVKDKAFPYPSKFGRSGGPIRNSEMVDYGADVCLAFPDEKSIGTWDLVKKAKAAAIPTFVITSLEDLWELRKFLEVK